MTDTNPFWSERHRPKTVQALILPARIKDTLLALVAKGELPNLLLAGPPGVGKTTAALAVLHELDYDVYVINGSLKGNIDTLRTEILDFASSVSFTGSRKVVLIDEADYLNAQSTQPALRNFMEEFSGNCGFVLTCNYKERIIEPLQSRCAVIDFSLSKKDKPQMLTEFFLRVKQILEQEGVEYDPEVVGQLISKHYPDWRRALNELQRHAASGKIDTGALSQAGEANYRGLITSMVRKDFTEVRKWVADNVDLDAQHVFRKFYDEASQYLTTDSVPQLILLIADYQYKARMVADQEINLAAFLVHTMASCQFRT